MKTNKKWSYDMYKKILDEYPTKGPELAEEMDVPRGMLVDKATTLHVGYGTPITDEEKQLIKLYGRKLGDAVMFLLPTRTQAEVHKELCALHYC